VVLARAIQQGLKLMDIRDKLILLTERMLHKDYDRKGSVAKKIKTLVIAWCQDELIGSKLPVTK
jgi:hypothetical protein